MKPPEALPESVARTLAAVYRLYATERRLTIRDIARVAGFRSPETAHRHVRSLERMGLVAYEPLARGTLRPTHRVLAVGEK